MTSHVGCDRGWTSRASQALRRPNGVDAGRIVKRAARAEAVAAQLLAETVQRVLVVEKQVGLVLANNLVNLPVELGLLGEVELLHRLVKQAVDLRVGVRAEVAPLAGAEDVLIGRRVPAGAPARHLRLKILA